MTHLVIVNGYPKVGKDTLISAMREHLSEDGISSANVSMIDATIGMLKGHPGLPDAMFEHKGTRTRKLLAAVHRALLDHSSAPLLALKDAVERSEAKVVFTCCREPDTITRLVDMARMLRWDVTTLLVTRSTHETPATEADANVLSYTYDVIADNDGDLGSVRSLARDVLNQIRAPSAKTVPEVILDSAIEKYKEHQRTQIITTVIQKTPKSRPITFTRLRRSKD